MQVRVARFEGIDVARVDEDAEMFKNMLRTDERPEWMPEEAFSTLRQGVKRVISVVDRSSGVSLDLIFTGNEDEAQRVDEALNSLTPPEGVGRRASVEQFELLFDQQLGLS